MIDKENEKKNSFLSLRKLSVEVEQKTGISISYQTIKNHFNSRNVFSYKVLKRPLLKKIHRESRLKAAKEWIMMDESLRKRIIFSDESKFNLFYSDGNVKVWRKPADGLNSKHSLKTVKHGGGSVMVWACFSYYGKGKLVFIDNTMTGASYVALLSKNLKSSARLMELYDYTFQQDNDPKHTSKISKEYFDKNGIDLLIWPSQSPDLNPIENLWALMKPLVAKLQPKNIKELKDAITKVWNDLDIELLKKLSLSFVKRGLKVIENKEWHINY